MFLSLDRQSHGEHRATRIVEAATDGQVAAVQGDDAVDQGQPEAAAFHAACVGAAIQFLEDLAQILGQDAHARIRHFDDPFLINICYNGMVPTLGIITPLPGLPVISPSR